MNNSDKSCTCSLCAQEFNPADGHTPEQHLAKSLLTVFAEMQMPHKNTVPPENPLPCPRCGVYRMSDKVTRNALSRHSSIYVCDICGVDEACRVYSGEVLPLSDWWIMNEILNKKTK